MPRYAVLILPSANRVYAGTAASLAAAEVAAFSDAVLGGALSAAEVTSRGGVPYLEFEAAELRPDALGFLANLSALYALFEVEHGLLRPVALHSLDRYDDDLLTIQKYPGKTNEQFTRLLLNVTLLASATAPEMLRRKITVLDPLCGRGTTLNQALMYGYDASGIEADRKDVEAYGTFIRTWLKRKRIKHKVGYDGPVRRDGKVAGRRLQITLAPSRDEQKAGRTQDLDVVCADTVRAGEFFRPGSADLVVTDLPYGVQHASKSASGRARRPQDLLAAAAPVWAGLLRPGGALGIAWNTLLAPRHEAAAILAAAGLAPVETGPYQGFRHRVDQAIVRDILVATRPAD